MELEKLLSKRRSIRKFKADLPDDSIIMKVIQAGFTVPTPSNSRPIKVSLIESEPMKNRLKVSLEEKKKELLDIAVKKQKNLVNSYWRFSEHMFNAPVLFAITYVEYNGFSKRMFNEGLIASDLQSEASVMITAGLTMQAMILMAQNLGLGSCILTAPLTIYPEIHKELNGFSKICAFLTLGFPDEDPVQNECIKLNDFFKRI